MSFPFEFCFDGRGDRRTPPVRAEDVTSQNVGPEWDKPTIDVLSAIGTKRTSASAPHMSAFGGKADMTYCAAHVCF